MKTCAKCGEGKAPIDFYKDASTYDMLSCCCKACNYEKTMAWRAANADRHRAQQKRWQIANRDANRTKDRERREKNREELSEVAKVRNDARMKTCADSYVALALRVPLATLTPEIIEAKRMQLQIGRLLKEMRK